MIAAHHFQLSDQALRDLHKEHPEDPFVRDIWSNLGWDGPGLSDSRLTELWLAPGGKISVTKNAYQVGYHCDTLSTSDQLQTATESLCDKVANPAMGSFCQDIEDTLDHDHCDDSPRAQSAHFMRATKQTTGDAFRASRDWILSNVETAAALMTTSLGAATANGSSKKKPSLTAGLASKHLGRAMHALQDSFSGGHTLRDFGEGGRTGAILHLYAYKTQDHADHAKEDIATVDTGYIYDSFSPFGRVVIRATKELVWLAIKMAHASMSFAESHPAWKAFMHKWLVLSPQWRHYTDNQSTV